MLLPDYNNSVLSTVSSVLKAYNIPSIYPSIPVLDSMLSPRPKNIIILLLDGLGVSTLEGILPEDGFLRRHWQHTVTSVFPSTTTAATTAYYTGQSPNEHGWLGWSLYFKECAQQLDIFQGVNPYTKQRYSPDSPAYKYMPFESVFAKIRRMTDDAIHTASIFPFPSGCDEGANTRLISGGKSFPHMLEMVEKQSAAGKGEQFILAYWTNPDSEAHGSGPLSPQSRALVTQMEKDVEAFCKRMEGTDSAIIISADHGLRGNMKPVFINRIPEIMECLIMPPTIETRAATFFVKPHRRAQFEKAFNDRFGESFVLYTRQQALDMKLFGWGEAHPKVDDFLGDYIACAVGDEYIEYAVLNQPEENRFVGAHAGLTEEEMLVPVIALRT